MKLKNSTKVLACLVATLGISAICQQDVSAKNIFVSPTGDNSDGSNWKKAIKDPGKINWSTVSTGDNIVIDGGPSSTTYVTNMVVPASGIVIRQSNQAGHNGQVIIRGPQVPTTPVPIGLDITGSNVHVVGNQRGGIKFYGFAAIGVNIQTSNNVLRNVEINTLTGVPPYGSGRIAGLTFGGYNNHFINCDIRDTTIGALSRPVAGLENLTVFRNCTFGASSYGFFGNSGTALSCSTGSTPAKIHAVSCAFGPFVNYGVDCFNDNVHITDSIFLAAGISNFRAEPTFGAPVATLNNCTMYDKTFLSGPGIPAVPVNINPAQITTNVAAKLKVKNSIVYGGIIKIPADQKINAGGNFQYNVSGNTVALAPSMIDPQFVDSATLSQPVAAVNFIPRTLTTSNFSTKPGSPATGKGSSFVRVSDMVAPYGPTTGFPTAIGGP